MESEDKYRGIAPVVLTIALLLLSLVPAQALGQDGDLGISPLQTPMDDGFAPEPVSDEPPQDPVDVPDVKEVISGKMPAEGFGGQIAGIGDVNNDNRDDFAVLLPARGYCVIYHGGHQMSEAIVHPLEGSNFVLTAQSQVRPAGDLDFDGFDDVLITAPDMYVNNMRAAGAVFVFYGTPSGLPEEPDQILHGIEKDMRFGSDVDSVGSINNDPYSDIIIGADGWNDAMGLVHLYLGGPYGLVENPIWTWEGENVGDRFGHAVTGAGDVNGDGYLDFAVAAPFATSGEGKGRIYIFYGRSELSKIEVDQVLKGSMRKSYFGLSIRLAGDVNNDGFSDLIISSPEHDSGAHLKAGKVELFLGTEHGIDTNPKLVVEGENNEALLGYTIAFLGDVNRDGFDDVAIGAPGHSSGGKTERGKFYIFLGSKSGFRNYPSVIELGDDAGDRLSTGLAAAGDIDGDKFNDVLVGAPGADAVGGIDCGELHIYRGTDITMPPLQADAFEVMDLTEDEFMLVEHRRYQLRMSVTHRTGLRALDHVDIHMDPEGEDVVLRFLRETQNLVEVKDPNDLVRGIFQLATESQTYLDTTDIIIDVWLNWGYPAGRPLSVRIEATDNHGLRSTERWSDAAVVVDRLNFDGDITIYGDRQGQLLSGDWISAKEGLSFTGALVAYDLASYGIDTEIAYYPPNNELSIVVEDDLGGVWFAPILKGAPISVHAMTPSSSRPEMTYALSIETNDRTKVFRTEQFQLNVDGTGVVFNNPEPVATIASLDATASIEIEDPLGPGVDPTTVQYRLATSAGRSGWSRWTDANNVAVNDEGSVVADVQEKFTEGLNLIKWQAKDLVGNGYTESEPYEIWVDLGNITFSNPLPVAGKWHKTESVVVGITIENTRGNRINLTDVQYRISTSPGEYTPWTTYDATPHAGSDRSKVSILANFPNSQFSEGDKNYIQWQAHDMERTEHISSPLYRILVDRSGPVFSLPSPAEDEWVNSREVTATIIVDDVLSGILDSTIGYHILGVDEEDVWHSPMSKTHRGDTIECKAYIRLREGMENYILWQAYDNVGHQSEIFSQQVRVDTTAPTVSENLPEPGVVSTTKFVEVSVRVSDIGAVDEVSGVDLRTLQYTIDRPESGQSSWIYPDIDTSIPIVPFDTISFFIEVEEGDNKLVWRVKDAVGNEVQTDPFTILADLPEVNEMAPVIIISAPVDNVIKVHKIVYFDASQSYHPRGEYLSYVWTSNLDGLLGMGPSFSDHLSTGLHTITLTVTAEDSGVTRETAFAISVEAPKETGGPFSTFWEQMALVLILVFILITLLLQRFRVKEWDI